MERRPGRPSKYRKEYGSILLEMMAKGKSVVEFCANIGISRDTFYGWVDKYPAFSDTYKKAVELCESYWEDIGKRGILGLSIVDKDGNASKINTGMYVFYMKNRFHWNDRIEQEISGGLQLIKVTEKEAEGLD
jgi:hypothetical protein